MEIDDITGVIVDAAVQVHRRSGPGCSSPCMRVSSPASSPSASFAWNANA